VVVVVVVAVAADTELNYELIQNCQSGLWIIDAADEFFAVSQPCEKNRSSAPLKNQVDHALTAL